MLDWLVPIRSLLEVFSKLIPMFDSLTQKLRRKPSVPVEVRWGPPDTKSPGVRVTPVTAPGHERFIPWPRLVTELHKRLVPKIFVKPDGYRFVVKDYSGKPSWLVRIVDEHNKETCAVWFGGNPLKGWASDGLIRVGYIEPFRVWQIYQRHSDGTYRQLESTFDSVEAALEDRPIPARKA